MPAWGKSRRSFIGLGSNLGGRRANCLEAVRRLSEREGVRVIGISRAYETEPQGIISKNNFINAVLEISTELGPESLIDLLLNIEAQMGRDRSAGPDRLIDLDILFMEGVIMSPEKNGGKLELPHPRAGKRAFVLIPWAELAPDLLVEPWGKTVRQMLEGLDSMHCVIDSLTWEREGLDA